MRLTRLQHRDPDEPILALSLGRPEPQVAEWSAELEQPVVATGLASAAPSGRRLASRLFGIAFDSFVAAVKAHVWHSRAILAFNPWIAVASRLLAGRNIACLGLYADPGSLTWKILRMALRDGPVVAFSPAEVAAWNAEGGRAAFILYGQTIGHTTPPHFTDERRTLFIGGTSQRDSQLTDRIVSRALAETENLRIVIADGTGPRHIREKVPDVSILYLPRIEAAEFFGYLKASDMSLVPIRSTARAAGQTLLVASAQFGIPVAASIVEALEPYQDIIPIYDLHAMLFDSRPFQDVLDSVLSSFPPGTELTRQWQRELSRCIFRMRATEALKGMGWPGEPGTLRS